MLDSVTKRRIDTARDILVGKVPDPKSQVEQITIALIYKFMDDMDAEAEEIGGHRTFFTGEFARYGWAKVMAPGIGGHEMLNLYGEGIAKMPENDGIPALFRDIFKNAYLPYRDPETLKSFLKIINEFEYDHSERLGDAFEYLLQVLGSQGDAGQFRTPRHLIDFMVAIMDPKKGETILDPACGTAGFLISAYKHILKNNLDKDGNSTLTPDEKGKMAKNFKGYDISPDMVRLSLVNLYLHGFTDPHIYEYDTLTSEDRWGEYADVILANPPFMSPKGGIIPHKKFSIQAKRSEVLFVDYIAEHLTTNGRAAIIVPEGIVFQSQTAYKDLRKLLVENSLVAVVSLPAGVFNPYSGVKTSILILDRATAKQSTTIGFFKIENDGFGLGAQRRAMDKNDIPQVQEELRAFLEALRMSIPSEDIHAASSQALIVSKEKIAENGDFNLSGERYRLGETRITSYPVVRLGEVAQVIAGQSPPGESYNSEGIGVPFYQGKTEFGDIKLGPPKTWTTAPQRFAEAQDILMSVRAPVGPVNVATEQICIGRGLAAIRPDREKLSMLFAFYFLRSQESNINGDSGAVFASINRSEIEAIEIPMPPLEVQREIVAEIEGYQKIINGAKAVIENYRPQIPINPEWPLVELGAVSELGRGFAFKSEDYVADGILSFRVSNIGKDRLPDLRNSVYLPADYLSKYKEYSLNEGDFVIVMVGATTGKIGYITKEILPALLNQNMWRFQTNETVLLKKYLYYALDQLPLFRQGGARDYLKMSDFQRNEIALPPLAIQEEIVKEITAEQALVNANKELITRFEKKIQSTLARIWGEEPVAESSDASSGTFEPVEPSDDELILT
jgi:type I restriction enzyme M protein